MKEIDLDYIRKLANTSKTNIPIIPEEKKSINDILEDIQLEASELICQNLKKKGIKYDNNAGTIYVDDTVEKKTYYFDVRLEECDEYGGEDNENEN